MYVTKTPFRLVAGALLLSMAISLSGCYENIPASSPPNTITNVVSTDSRFSILRAAVVKAGLTDLFSGGLYTVFAPTDEAFRASGIQNVDGLTAAQLDAILRYHVLLYRTPAADIQSGTNLPQTTLLGGPNGTIYVTKNGSSVSVNGRRVTQADVPTTNGIIHVIDGVLLPPSGDVVSTVLADPQNYSLLAAAVTRAGTAISSALGSATNITLFAPTNQAFIDAGLSATAIAAAPPATLARVLSYHVVPGRVFSTQLSDGLTVGTLLGPSPQLRFGVTAQGVTVRGAGNGTNAATVTNANTLTTNAVIHRINRVLLPGS
jgi:uncharacterized surface protein with fasciclin (FAS1) repeats